MSTATLPNLCGAEPACIVAGDTAEWQLDLQLYPATTWVLSYALRGAQDGQYINFSETPTPPIGTTHLIQLLPAVTIKWIPGLYKFQAYVTNATTTDRVTIGWGDIEIIADLAMSDPADPRTYNRQTRDILRAALSGRLPRGMEHYSIGGRAISKIPLTQLNMLLREYQDYVNQEENQERIRKGLGDKNLIRATFTNVNPGVNGAWGPWW
jgi:hypothetical protein